MQVAPAFLGARQLEHFVSGIACGCAIVTEYSGDTVCMRVSCKLTAPLRPSGSAVLRSSLHDDKKEGACPEAIPDRRTSNMEPVQSYPDMIRNMAASHNANALPRSTRTCYYNGSTLTSLLSA